MTWLEELSRCRIATRMWGPGACWRIGLLLALPGARFHAAEVVLRPLPTNAPMLSDGLGRFHAGPAHWTIEGGRVARMGSTLSRRADFDGDGRPDLVVAAPRFVTERREMGKVWTLSTGSNGWRVAWSWNGSPSMTRAGTALATADFDGDGFTDLAVGIPTEKSRGEVWVFHGSRTNLSREPAQRLTGNRTSGKFGARLLARDVNGDGRDDLLVGAASAEARDSRLLLFLGSTNGLSASPAWVMEGRDPSRRLGAKFALLDANGDGQLDLVVGFPNHASVTSGINAGRVELFMGTNGAFAPAVAWSWEGEGAGAMVGQTVRALGDLDQDGREELSVDCAGSQIVSIFHGTVDGLSRTSAWSRRLSGLDPDGDSLRGVGDVNGDGWHDVLAWDGNKASSSGESPVAQLFLGGPGGLPLEPSWTARLIGPRTTAGHYLTPLGDINQDGLADFAVASPNYGKVHADGKTSTEMARAGRIDIFLGQRRGYGADEVFPMDGVNSQSREQTVAELEQAIATATALPAVSPVTSRYSSWWPWAITLALAAGVIVALWSRNRESDAAASAVKSERERLARDLHDGLGSGVHRLQRLTELLDQAEPGSEGARRLREDMLRSAQELSGSLDRAVWAVKPENDTLENLLSFFAVYAPSVLDPHGIDCELDFPAALPALILPGDTRQNWFFAVNEALQNVVKHACAGRVCLRATWAVPWLNVTIEDEGCGWNDATDRAGGGHGLEHLRARMNALGGSAQWSPRPRGGWRVELRAPLAASM